MAPDESVERPPPKSTKELPPFTTGAGFGAGLGVIVLFVLRDAAPNNVLSALPPYLRAAVVIGPAVFFGGFVAVLLDRWRATRPTSAEASPGSSLGRSFAVLSLLASPLIGIGLLLAVTATLMNRKTRGWPRILSVVALALSLVVTGIVAFVLIVVRPWQRH
jgi:hypothetical protein